jgi:sulfate permease
VNVLLLLFIAIVVALFFAANIGASGTAAAMGAAYGGGALKSRKTAVILVALFAFIGANLGGSEVVTTVSEGIIPRNIITLEISVIILLSAALTLFMANKVGIPLSTSEVTVGSIVGVGIAFQKLNIEMLVFIVISWLILPFLAFSIAYVSGRLLKPVESKAMRKFPILLPKALTVLLIIAGCYEALSAGMNNVANAIGPLVGSGVIDITLGIFLGSIFLGIGAIALGGRVLETNGKKITTLSLLQGSIVSFTSGTLVIIASLFGMPVPLTQATTMSIMGVGSEQVGMGLFKKPVVRRIFKIWVLSPVLSLVVSFSLIQITVFQSFMYLFLIVFFVIVVSLFAYLKFKYQPKSKTVRD